MNPERWQQINQLFESALRRGAPQRPAFLAEACKGDEALRDEVESLIASHERAQSFIEEPAVAVAARLMADEDRASLVGRAVGHYRVLSYIGAGGMGEVYLAEDTRLGRRVALKLLPDDLAGDEQRARRFEQEARAASALNHPNIITIYDIGRADSRHFIATEFIEGETLRQRLSRGVMNTGEALDVAIPVASALAAAHEAGITHRDVKPENVMLRRDRIVKVLDFGLAKLAAQPLSSTDTQAPTHVPVQTAPGVVMGTARYMSPEQARGLEVDARTDIWSLGCVLYEMAAGRVPFEGETPSDTLSLILQKEPSPLARFAPEAPEELQRIVAKALVKDPDGRYQTVKDLLIDLQRLRQRLELDAEIERSAQTDTAVAPTSATVAARTTSSAEYFVRGLARSRRGVALAAALFIATAAAAYLYFVPRGREINSLAVLPLVNASDNPEAEYLSDGITESLINNLSRLPNLRVMSRNSVFRYKGRETDVRDVGRALGVDAVLTGRVVQRGDGLVVSVELVDARDNTHIWGEQYNRRLSDLLVVQGEISREVLEKLRLRLTGEEERRATKRYTENTEAYQLYLKGRFYWNKRTVDGLKKGVEYFEQAIDLDPNYALAYSGLSDSYMNLSFNGMVPPGETRTKGLAAARRAVELDPTLAEARTSLAAALERFEWDWEGATREYQKALELNPDYATAHHRYGMFLATILGRFDEGIAELKRAQQLDPTSLIINADLGFAYHIARRYDEAIEQLHRTIEMDPNFPRSHFYLGLCYGMKEKYDEAIAQLLKARTLLGGNTVTLQGQLGSVYARSGRREEALRILAELEEESQRRYVSPLSFGAIYSNLGDKERAFDYYEKAFAERDPGLPGIRHAPALERSGLKSHPRFAETMRRIGLPL